MENVVDVKVFVVTRSPNSRLCWREDKRFLKSIRHKRLLNWFYFSSSFFFFLIYFFPFSISFFLFTYLFQTKFPRETGGDEGKTHLFSLKHLRPTVCFDSSFKRPSLFHPGDTRKTFSFSRLFLPLNFLFTYFLFTYFLFTYLFIHVFNPTSLYLSDFVSSWKDSLQFWEKSGGLTTDNDRQNRLANCC